MTPPPAGRCLLPWRSDRLGWLAFAAIVVVGGPLFLRMPLWVDVTLYDVAARNILAGGVHYRDVFDTNPPGFTWLLCVIRPLLGRSIEAVRAVDLVVVGAIGALLLRAARRGGATHAGVAWGAACLAGFYLFISEFNHAQRDTWMMLPALLATAYRLHRQRTARDNDRSPRWVCGTGVLEGLIWGVGVWIKPHVLPIAVVVWAVLLTRWGTGGPGDRRGRRVWADLSGVLLGGLLAGGAGVAWLVGSGTWPYFLDVFTRWNTAYATRTFDEFGSRFKVQFEYFPPWSLLFVLAVPVAVLNLIDARPWRTPRRDDGGGPISRTFTTWLYTPAADPDARTYRLVLAGLYLAWVANGLFLQRQFHYVHVPETLLMVALFAANRWAVGVLALVGQFAVVGWLAVRPETGEPLRPPRQFERTPLEHLLWTFPDRCPNRLKWWPACVSRGVTGEVRNGVAFQSNYFSGTDHAGLEEVAAFLRQQGVKDGEVLAFNDSPHVVYLILDIKPGMRFMHFSTAPAMGEAQYYWVQEEVEERLNNPNPPIKYIVSDLKRWSLYVPPSEEWQFDEPGPNPHDHLPPAINRLDEPDFKIRDLFPLDQPTVFRTGNGRGRYVVHVPTKKPIGWIFSPW